MLKQEKTFILSYIFGGNGMVNHKVNKYIWIILPIIALIGMTITYPNSSEVIRFNNNPMISLLSLILSILMALILRKKVYGMPTKYDIFVGFIFSFLFNITSLLNSQQHNNIHGLKNICLDIFAIIGWTTLFSVIFLFIRCCFGNNIRKKYDISYKNIWIIISICWLIGIIGFLPGQISWDGLRQFCEFERTKYSALNFTYVPTNHHPWIVTQIFGLLYSIGNYCGGTNVGVFTVVCFQFLVSSYIYTDVVKYVWNKAGDIFGIVSLVLFASPIFSSYAVTIDKSTLYYAFAAEFYKCFLVLMDSILKEQNPIFKKYLLFVLSSIAFSIFRNDSIAIVIISLVIVVIASFSNSRKRVLSILTVLLLLLVHIGCNIYLSTNGVIKSSPSEALTLPTRQLSYIVIHKKPSLNTSELNIINKITPIDQIHRNFSLSNGDNLKNLFPSNTFLNDENVIKSIQKHKKTLSTTKTEKKELLSYLKVWAKVGFANPVDYLAVYFGANSFYLNPFLSYGNGLFLNYFYATPALIHPTWYKQYHPLFSAKIREMWRSAVIGIVSIPPFAIILNAATGIWLSVLLFFINLKQNEEKKWLLLIPQVIMCALITIVSVNGYTRYTIGLLATLPITYSYVWHDVYMNHKGIKKNI